MFCQNLLTALSRKKYDYYEDDDCEIDNDSVQTITRANSDTEDKIKLARVLGLFDLIMLGVGATLGVGVYVLAGSVAKNQAGPSVVISFFIAALASLFSGLCYSEFASRISKSGSAYNYTYLSIGEFAAYIIGWNLILEYIIGTASEAKAISNQIDCLLGNVYQRTMTNLWPIQSPFLSSYPDFIAPAFVIIITSLLSWGVKESTKINNTFTFVNLVTVGLIVFTGLFKINIKNWSIKKENIPKTVENGGNGGFMPFGINGIIVGAAKCFFGFVGFDAISTTGEESKNPKRNIPLAIVLSLCIVFVCYFSIAFVLTAIVPYYEQDADAPFPHIFNQLGWQLMKWIVTIGSLFALFTAMFGAFFPLPRILYSMSRDGLLYKKFSHVSPFTKTPLISTFVSGLITAVMSAVFKLDQLVDMMSIGTLLAYIIVAVCVLILRFSDESLSKKNVIQPDIVNVCTLGNEYKHVYRGQERQVLTVQEEMEHKIKSKQVCEKSTEVVNGNENFNNKIKNMINYSTEKSNKERCFNTAIDMDNEFTQTSNDTNPNSKRIFSQFHETINENTSSTNKEYKTISDDGQANKVYNTMDKIKTPKETNKNLPQIKPKSIVLTTQINTKSIKLNEKDGKNDKSGNFFNALRMLLNTKNTKNVTLKSEAISKTCIYLLILLTIVIGFLLNDITTQRKNMEFSNALLKMSNLDFEKVSNNSVDFNESFEKYLKKNSELFNNLNRDKEIHNKMKFKNVIHIQNGKAKTEFFNLNSQIDQLRNVDELDKKILTTDNQLNKIFVSNKFEYGKKYETEHNELSESKKLKNVKTLFSLDSEIVQDDMKTQDKFIDENFKEILEMSLDEYKKYYKLSEYRRTHGLQTLSELFRESIYRKQTLTHVRSILNLDEATQGKIKYTFYFVIGLLYALTFLILCRQGQNKKALKFKVPCVPLVPCISIFMNIYLMINLDISTWVRFVIWLAIGMVIYFTYSIFHSKQKKY